MFFQGIPGTVSYPIPPGPSTTVVVELELQWEYRNLDIFTQDSSRSICTVSCIVSHVLVLVCTRRERDSFRWSGVMFFVWILEVGRGALLIRSSSMTYYSTCGTVDDTVVVLVHEYSYWEIYQYCRVLLVRESWYVYPVRMHTLPVAGVLVWHTVWHTSSESTEFGECWEAYDIWHMNRVLLVPSSHTCTGTTYRVSYVCYADSTPAPSVDTSTGYW